MLTDTPCEVVRNDVDLSYVSKFDTLVFSPGPGLPEEAGNMMEILDASLQHKKILGVCLGHQALGLASGSKLKQLSNVMHGVERNCYVINDSHLTQNVASPFSAGRYHSWVIDAKTLSPEWIVDALDDDNEIMLMHHRHYNLTGMQFHPESIMTDYGKQLLLNWLNH